MDGILKIIVVFSILAQTYSAPRSPRLTVAEYEPNIIYPHYNAKSQTYSFGYDVSDPLTGNNQYRSEERYPNGTVTGTYGYIDPNGRPMKFKYIADNFGYRVYSDVVTPRPLPIALVSAAPTESSISWTRPPRPHKKKVLNDLVSQLGSFFSKTNFV